MDWECSRYDVPSRDQSAGLQWLIRLDRSNRAETCALLAWRPNSFNGVSGLNVKGGSDVLVGLNVLSGCNIIRNANVLGGLVHLTVSICIVISICLTIARCSMTSQGIWPAFPKRAGWPVGYRAFRIVKRSTIVVYITTTSWPGGMFSVNGRSLVVKLKAIENTMGLSPIYPSHPLIPRLLTSDPLVLLDRLTSDLFSKSIGNQQSLDHWERVVCNGLSWGLWQWGDIEQFNKGGGVDEMSWIRRYDKNEVASRIKIYMPRHVTDHVLTSFHKIRSNFETTTTL